ncbi:hypothetical protein DFQ27_003468 [Actinomortierella ambigua]|uniref:Superoxide dismutase copper/zinc binding domain-containing protein n=1 Tax=Actinomortierella ambigua TaxID=1343610 RepID=A0A9P6Q5U6_9FUNG|nr:hypothetical protein DFQ27_003468 [Actinomortierella ambigua]
MPYRCLPLMRFTYCKPKGDIIGEFQFVPLQEGARVTFEFKSGLTIKAALAPSKGYEYHIHEKPVGPNGDCNATLGHLDPDNIGMTTKCKFGEIMGTVSGAIPLTSYVDKSLAFGNGPRSIEHHSVVIHNNGTRIACANIVPQVHCPFWASPNSTASVSEENNNVVVSEDSSKSTSQ